jgi:hypothetical protein
MMCDPSQWIGRRLDDVHTEALLHRVDARVVQINKFHYDRKNDHPRRHNFVGLVITISIAPLVAWNATSALMFCTTNPDHCNVARAIPM